VTRRRGEIAGGGHGAGLLGDCFDDNIHICEVKAGMIRGAGVKVPGNLVAVAASGGLLTSTLVPFHSLQPRHSACGGFCCTRHRRRRPRLLPLFLCP
jgi:hypothetical protein